MIEEQQLRERTSALVLEWSTKRQPPVTGETAEGFADAIVAAHLVADEGRLNLNRWIDAARRAGLSWTDVGSALGISKQAAQQRFGSAVLDDDPAPEAGEDIVRLGATAFNEMRILREEGLKGRELMRTGALTLVFRPTGRTWEYSRLVGSRSMISEMKRAGWTYVSSWLPFHYFKRPVAAD